MTLASRISVLVTASSANLSLITASALIFGPVTATVARSAVLTSPLTMSSLNTVFAARALLLSAKNSAT